ncbi:MAG TPA: MlaD family protein [Verrucomicrobiae bacterium]|nr:MlaD family protein [Verrucomicrobiae bacterium]
MSKSRSDLKVGLFVLVCLGVLAVLLLQFSKGASSLFRSTYTVILRSRNVGGLKARAQVLMSGVQVGSVAKTLLGPEGTNVTIYLTIFSEYTIRNDARFVIEQSGFLGDQYVAVYPEQNQGAPLRAPNNTASAQEPFNLQEVARSAAGFIQRVDETVKKLNDAINDVRRLVLNEQTLTNLSFTIGTFRQVSEDALGTVQNINLLVKTNGIPASTAISNLVVFSDQLNTFAGTAQGILTNNGPQINVAVQNVVTATASLTNLLNEVQTGHGLLGNLVKNDELSTDVSLLASNLMVTSSNLNRFGLWRIIRAPRQPRTNEPSATQKYPGRNPFD